MNLRELKIKKYHKMLEQNEITSRTLIEFYLKRIAEYDDVLNSIICINEKALEEADALDTYYKEHGLKGKLHGVPILLKDNVETKGMETTAGSKSLEGYMADDDAPIVTLMKEAGAIILAKTNLHEFAIWGETISSIKGQTVNPYDLTRTPGGSSGGTGAAVASDFGMIGIGTDTINSIRSPSSANSLVGIRPTVGLIEKKGVVPYSFTQDAVGPIARTVEDAGILLEVMSQKSLDDSPIDLKEIRIGILNDFFGTEDNHKEVNQAVSKQLILLEKHGVVFIDLDDCFDSSELVNNVSVHLYELKDHLNNYLSCLPKQAPSHSVQDILDSGKYHKGIEENLLKANELSTTSEAYQQRLELRKNVQNKLRGLFESNDLDAIVYPHQKQLVCKIGESQLERNGVLASVTGYPSVCTPAGYSSESTEAPIGVPIGMEILGLPYTESKLVNIASKLEELSCIRKSPLSVE